MKIVFDWDSGPYATYCRLDQIPVAAQSAFEKNAVEIPEELYERYRSAQEVMSKAEDEMLELERAQCK